MKDYIFYLGKKPEYKKFFDKIKEAGGYEAAKVGSPAFLKGWPEWSKDKAFAESQFAFLRDQKLNPVLQRIKDIKGLNFEDRHLVILDVIYSMSVNHGRASNVIKDALGQDVSKLSDEEMINKLYDQRVKYVKNQKQDKYKENMIKIRYPNERQKALNFFKK